MKTKNFILVFIVTVILSGCATVNQATLYQAQDIYRNNYLAFYKKVTQHITTNNQDGRFHYNEETISQFYHKMIQDIQAQYDASGIRIKVNPLNQSDWGVLNHETYLRFLGVTINKVKSRYRKDYLHSRPIAPDVTAAFLLRRGWDISQNGFAQLKPPGDTYNLPLFITVAVANVYNHQWKFELNTRGFQLPSQFIGKTSDKNARKAEVAAVNWQFNGAETFLAKAERPPEKLKGFINNQKALDQIYTSKLNQSNNSTDVGKRIDATLKWIDRNKWWIKALANSLE